MLNIMYHFVGGDERLKGISLSDFRQQLDACVRDYSPSGFTATFDHGTIDHLHTAAPELERRGLRGLFFVLTMVQEERRVPTIDKQRFLEATLRRDLPRHLCAELGIPYRPEEAAGYLSQFSFYSLEERYLRLLRDTRISADSFDTFIATRFARTFGDEDAFAASHYLTWEQVIELHHRGHVIGSHSHAHIGDRADYARSCALIAARTQVAPRHVSYPNGVKRISDSDLMAIGIEKGYLSSPKGLGNPYQTDRIDCFEWPCDAMAAERRGE